MGISLISPAGGMPLSMEDVKAWCSIDEDDTDRDAMITIALKGAVRQVERHIAQSIAVQGWRLTLDHFCDLIEFPRGPVTEITSFIYLDPYGVEQVVESAWYTLDRSSWPQRIIRNPEFSWPDTYDHACSVTLEFNAAMADDGWDDIKTAILMTVASRLENRENAELPAAAIQILRAHRLVSL